jgi:hypothetical protein
MECQVEKAHYELAQYVDIARWSSYFHQIEEVNRLKPASVLVVGIGDSIVVDILRKQGITVYTLDFDKELQPDFYGSVSKLDSIIGNLNIDVILCCQVLEHLPYDFFQSTLSMMKTHAPNVIISLPYSNRYLFRFLFKIPYIRPCIANILIPTFWDSWEGLKYGEHYWEVGCKNYPLKRIKKDIQQIFKIEKMYYPKENVYHLFFCLRSLIQ